MDKTLVRRFYQAIDKANHPRELERIRLDAFGKKGEFTALMKRLAAMDAARRPEFGKLVNRARLGVQEALNAKLRQLESDALDAELAAERVDVTLTPKRFIGGRIHPISAVLEEIIGIFLEMGFAVADGPEIEDDFHNFSGLNIPADHPARQMHDTFYLDDESLLRTHTSPVQIRALKAQGAPIMVIAPGRVYRHDNDQTHTPMFHQVEGLAVANGLHMGHLKGCLEQFISRFFGNQGAKTRLRPSYFPFTEPSAEVDVLLEIGGKKTWMEILGCGMVHQNVLKTCGVDPNKWQGFAFGLGVERLAMLKYRIDDLRLFFANQKPWLEHYGVATERLL